MQSERDRITYELEARSALIYREWHVACAQKEVKINGKKDNSK